MPRLNRIVEIICLASVFLSSFNSQASDAKGNYMLQCQGCHKANGEGILGSVPNFHVSGSQILKIAEGREFFIRVPGSAYSPLSDQELTDVLNYIIEDIIAQKTIAKYTLEEVSLHRTRRLVNVAETRQRIIEKTNRQAMSN